MPEPQPSAFDDIAQFPAGRILWGQYEIIEYKGQGLTGAVYRVWDQLLKEEKAIKIFYPELTGNEKHLNRFLWESKSVLRLRRSNIVKVYNFLKQDNLLYISMEYVSDETLRRRIDRMSEPFSYETALHLFIQISDALEYAHQYVLHRNLKPENIFITPDNQLKIADFGQTTSIKGSAFLEKVQGNASEQYLAPEQRAPDKETDEKTDVYAAGLLFYEISAGRPSGGPPYAGLRKKREEFPEELEAVVMGMVESDRNRRISNFQIIKKRLLGLKEREAEPAAALLMNGERGDEKTEDRVFGGSKQTERPVNPFTPAGHSSPSSAVTETSQPTLPPASFSEGTDQETATGSDGVNELIQEAVMLRKAGRFEEAIRIWQSLSWRNVDGVDPSEEIRKLKLEKSEIEEKKRAETMLDSVRRKAAEAEKEGRHEKAYRLWNSLAAEIPSLKNETNAELKRLNAVIEKNKWAKQLETEKMDALKARARRYEDAGKKEKALTSWQQLKAMPGADEEITEAVKRLSFEINREKEEQIMWEQRGKFKAGLEKLFVALFMLSVLAAVAALIMIEYKNRRPFTVRESSNRVYANKKLTGSSLLVESINYKMMRIKPGEFMMGSPETEKMRGSDEALHKVVVSRTFYIGAAEVTQGQYAEIMGINPSHFKGYALPVESVNWYAAITFCNLLSEKENLPPAYEINSDRVAWLNNSNGYRLPTEAEWEYACRAGTDGPFNTGKNLETTQANYNGIFPYAGHSRGDYRKRTLPVRSFAPNRFGLYDMHGNVWEWCWDSYEKYTAQTGSDPFSKSESSERIARGGGWDSNAASCRSACRTKVTAGYGTEFIGFRIAVYAE